MVNFVCCLECKSETEDTIHALWGCHSFIAIWNLDGELKKMLRYKFCVFSDLLEMAFQMRSSVDVDLLAMMFCLFGIIEMLEEVVSSTQRII